MCEVVGVWYGEMLVVGCGMVWYGMVRCGMVWCVGKFEDDEWPD